MSPQVRRPKSRLAVAKAAVAKRSRKRSSSGSTSKKPRRRPPKSSNASVASSSKKSWKETDDDDDDDTGTSHIVCAVAENRANETCVVSIDARAPQASLQLTKLTANNGSTYTETMHWLRLIEPHEIVLNQARGGSPLATKILEAFPTSSSTVVTFVSRAFFDQTRGSELLQLLAQPESSYEASTIGTDYIVASAAHALLHYLQRELGATFAAKSMFLQWNDQGAAHKMAIDRTSLWQLEVLAHSKTGRPAGSLLDAVDRTKTAVGRRLLRSSLVAPPNHKSTIVARLDLVDALLSTQAFFYDVLEGLKALPNIEKSLAGITMMPRPTESVGVQTRLPAASRAAASKADDETTATASDRQNGKTDVNEASVVTPKLASAGISALVSIKTTLEALPKLAQILDNHLQEYMTSPMEGGTNQRAGRNEGESDDDGPDIDERTARTSIRWAAGRIGGIHAAPETQDDSTSASSDTEDGNEDTPEKVLKGRHPLLRVILIVLRQPILQHIQQEIDNVFTPSTTYESNPNAQRHQECFALRPKDSEKNSYMDIIRKAFLKNVDEIYQKADEYAQTYGMHVVVKYSAQQGYYLSMGAEHAASLPAIFLQPAKKHNTIACTTEEVFSLNKRAQYNVKDLLKITYQEITSTMEYCRDHLDALAAVSDAVAILDFCHSSADLVTQDTQKWVRPILTDENDHSEAAGILEIRQGRHPLVAKQDTLIADASFIPNDTHASQDKAFFTVLTGINGSGKSTYIQQIALIVLLAHIGSYVPAEQATIPIRDRLCVRMGTADDPGKPHMELYEVLLNCHLTFLREIENNISTFLMEMRETAFLCRAATAKSLVLVDELGRATSNVDGISLAWAICEDLIRKKCMTFFVTHFPQLTQLSLLYEPHVQNQHLQASIERRHQHGDQSEGSIAYTHKVVSGHCSVGADYGVAMAGACGWPGSALQAANSIEMNLRDTLPDLGFKVHGSENEERIEAELKKTYDKIIALVRDSADVAELRKGLQSVELDVEKKGILTTGAPEEDSNDATSASEPNDDGENLPTESQSSERAREVAPLARTDEPKLERRQSTSSMSTTDSSSDSDESSSDESSPV